MKDDTDTPPDRSQCQRIDIGVHVKGWTILLNALDERLNFHHDLSCSACGSMGFFYSAGVIQYCFWGGLRKDTLYIFCN